MRSPIFLAAFSLGLAASSPVLSQPASTVNEMVRAGEILPLDAIRNQVIASTRGDFVGVEFDVTSRHYRFKFLVDGTLVNVDVDARTGRRLTGRQNY